MKPTRVIMAALLAICAIGFSNPAESKSFTLAVSSDGTDGGILSKSEPDVTQLKIVTYAKRPGRAKPTAWGIDSTYIGPGEIEKLIKVDIYLDSMSRISSIKITRESNVGDIITILFNDVLELSIETLKKGVKKPSKKTPITIYSAGSVTFP